MTETEIQSRVIQWAIAMEHLIPQLSKLHHSPNGDLRHVKVAQRLKGMGVKAGFPDLFLPVIRLPYGGLFIEVKKEGGKVSKKQQEWANYLNEEGYRCVCLNSVDAIVAELMTYLLGEEVGELFLSE
jgi:hypothetical protein